MSIDLTPADKEAVRALKRLRYNQDFEAFRAWVAKCLAEQRERNDTLAGDQLKWSQGQCQALQKILDAQEVAVKILKSDR
jgi:hypothetical protein